jgi:hypothetical protein
MSKEKMNDSTVKQIKQDRDKIIKENQIIKK